MNYLKFPLGWQEAGAVAVATLQGVESDVFLVDSFNLSAFERGRQFQYHGGHQRRSPVRLVVPSVGDWTVVVIPTGGRVEARVEVLAA